MLVWARSHTMSIYCTCIFFFSSNAIIIMISLLRWWSAFCDFILCLKHAFSIATLSRTHACAMKMTLALVSFVSKQNSVKNIVRQWQKETFLFPWQFWMRRSQSITGEFHVCPRVRVSMVLWCLFSVSMSKCVMIMIDLASIFFSHTKTSIPKKKQHVQIAHVSRWDSEYAQHADHTWLLLFFS